MNTKKMQKLALLLAAGLALWGSVQAEDTKNTPVPVDVQSKKSSPVFLGVVIGPVPEAVQAQLPKDITPHQGLLVRRVLPGSPAEQAQIQRHDVLLSFNDKKLITPDDLVQAVQATKAGDKAQIELLRHGQVLKKEVSLATHPAFAKRTAPLPPHPRARTWQDAQLQAWEHFESFSLEKGADGRYTAKVQIRDADGNEQNFEFVGSRDEIREQIRKEKNLPAAQKRQLLSALDDGLRMPPFPRMPSFEELEREFFAPPPWWRDKPAFWNMPPGFWGDY